MEIKQYQAAIEAIVFASGEPVPVSRLALALELDEDTTRRIAEDWAQDINTRGGGITAHNLTDKTGPLMGIRCVTMNDDLLLINDAGVVIRMGMEDIRICGRNSQGVRLIRMDEDMKVISVPISPILSPQQNAAKFYKDYTKLKNAEKELTKQMELGESELYYLQSVLEELNRAQTEAELEEIRRELQEGGYLKADPGKRKMKQGKLPPMRFESTDGYPIYVGRNNRQNDELTFKLARKDDIWCHASKVHGSHVIISCGGTTPPDDTITQAAQLAAYYAETKGGQNLPVDVTPVKQVKKTPGGKPGMVIYHTYKTVIANPYADIVVDALNAEKKPAE